MIYTSKDFKEDTAVVAYANDPVKALNQLKKVHGKIKGVVEKGHKYRLGKVYTEKKGGNYFVVFPIISDSGEVSDEMWTEVEKETSFWMYQVVEDNKLDEVWGFEGQREADDVIEVMFHLK